MPEFEACSWIRKRPDTIWIFSYICFDFSPAGETEMYGKIQIVTRRFRMLLHA